MGGGGRGGDPRDQAPSPTDSYSLQILFGFAFSVSLTALLYFPNPSTGGHHTSALAAPVVLTAPDRAVLMGADDD